MAPCFAFGRASCCVTLREHRTRMPAAARPFDWGTLSLLRLPTVRLPPGDDAERARIETILGLSRVYLSVFALVAVLLDRTEPSYLAGFAYGLLAAYVLWSIAVFGLVVTKRVLRNRVAKLFQACDIAWPVLLTSLTTGASSPLMPSMMFALIAAAYRWGLRAALLAAAVASASLAGQSVLLYMLGVTHELFVNALIIRTAGYLVMALLIGVLADTEKLRRMRATTLARLTVRSRTGRNIRATIASGLKEVAQIFDAPVVELAIREHQADAFAWRFERDTAALRYLTLNAAQCQTTFAQDLPSALLVRLWSPRGGRRHEISLDNEGARIRLPRSNQAVDEFAAHHEARAIASASYRARADLEARLIVLDPGAFAGAADVQFLQALVEHVGPGLHNHYLSTRLRRQMGPPDRARLARELHDGVVQSLIGVELRLAVLRRAPNTTVEVADEIHKAQLLIREEAVGLREMMQRLRPLDLEDKTFLEFVQVAIDRFRRETGIMTALQTDLETVTLEPRVARALGRILQESLMNVRRHSRAENAIVCLHRRAQTLVLKIEDDGRGFEAFAGRIEGQALAQDLRMPQSIKEHARAIGATLAFESAPGAGSRVEVQVADTTEGGRVAS
jgi:signal transduction histidine kinase